MTAAATPGVLVPLDGSTLAEAALPAAAALAHRRGGVLHLVTARVADLAEPPVGWRGYLDELGEQLALSHGVDFVGAVLHGSPSEALAEYVRDERIGLVVMTTHGRSGASRCWIGSVADRLLRKVAAPVLLVRPNAEPAPRHFHRILVALDGSAGAKEVLDAAVGLGALHPGTEYNLIQVVAPAAASERREAAARELARRAERLGDEGAVVMVQAVVAEPVAERLMELAGSLRCDLIVVGSERPRPLARQVLGSVADKVVRGATHPVLLVPVGRQNAPVRGTTGRKRRAASTAFRAAR